MCFLESNSIAYLALNNDIYLLVPAVKRIFLLVAVCIVLSTRADAQGKRDSLSISYLISSAYKLFLQNPDSSILLAHRALARARENDNAYLEGESYFILSKANWAKGNYKLSMDYGFKSIKIFKSENHPVELALSQLSVARTFIDLKNYPKASLLIRSSIAISEKLNDKYLLAESYREQSMLLTSLMQYDSALLMVDRGLALFRPFNDTLNISILYSRKAKIFFYEKKFRQSLRLTLAAARMDESVKNNRALGITFLMAAENYYSLGKPDSAMIFALKSIPYNQIVSNYQTLVNAHGLISRIYLDRMDNNGAVEHLKRVIQYKDSVANARNNAKLQELQMMYDLEIKDKTIADLENVNQVNKQQVASQRLLMSVLVGGIILLGALLLMFMKLRNIQQKANVQLSAKNQAIEEQKEHIEAQAQKLERLNNLKSKLFSVISHDIRGPISSLHSLLELLTNKGMSQEEFIVISNKLKGNINVTQRTLENLLTWSLSQMDGLKTERKIVRIQDVIEESCRLMDEVASQKNVTLIRDVSESHLVNADPDQVQLILRNLVQNAIKFSKQHGTVLLTVINHSKYCKVTVKDFGIGMDQHEIALVMGAMSHFTKAGTQQEKGTGLGLLLCQEFVKRNGGTFSVQSVPGEGTEFSVSFESAKFSNG
jgi:two-component system, sensor histidine kinase and response regulator